MPNLITTIVEKASLTLTPIAGAVSHISSTPLIKFMMSVSTGSTTHTASGNLLLTPAQWGGQFLGSGLPVISMAEGTLISLSALLDSPGATKPTKLLNFLSGLPLIIDGWHALSAATWQASLMMTAQGYAIKSGYDFIKEIGLLMVENKHPNSGYKPHYDKLIRHGLKFAGFLCLSLGATWFTAGFVCLAIAATLQHSKTVQHIANSPLSFFTGCCTKSRLTDTNYNNNDDLCTPWSQQSNKVYT